MPEVQTIDQLREYLGARSKRFLELWVHKADGQALCALINDQRGWLMYLREDGDAGFSSRDPEGRDSANAMIEYVLDNGQHDSYPASWALPVSEIERAFEFFILNSQPADWILWHNDSQDGAVIGKAA